MGKYFIIEIHVKGFYYKMHEKGFYNRNAWERVL